MKRILTVLIVVLFVAVGSYALTDVIIVIVPDPPGGETPPTTLYVDDDTVCGGNTPCYTTIQAAVDDAGEADTVYVYAGIYYEHVTIGKPLTLQGEDRDTTEINGSGTGYVIYANANNVTVTGFKITNGNYGIRAAWASNIVISNNEVYGNVFRGIHLDSTTNSYVENNKVYSNDSGISVGYMAESNTIRNNVVRHNYLGINFGAEVHLDPNYAYHNDLINNERQANNSRAGNIWDDSYPSGGNYWSDYTGVDSDPDGGDGIGDTPYVIISGEPPNQNSNQDNYPLMSPLNTTNAQDVNFEIRKTITIPVEHSGANVRYVGDLDYDGNLDIAYAWWNATVGDTFSYVIEGEGDIELEGDTFAPRFTQRGNCWTAAEIDGDNYPEIFMTQGLSAIIFEATGDNAYTQRLSMGIPGPKLEPYPTVGDSDGDGSLDYLIPSEYSAVFIYEARDNDTYVDDGTLPGVRNPGNIRLVGVSDLDGDGYPETVYTANPFNNYNNTLKVFAGEDGTREEVYSSFVAQFNCQALGDLDGDGQGEIIGNTVYTNELIIYESQGSNNDFQIVYQAPRDPLYPYSLGVNAVMDFDGDGQWELWRPIDIDSGQLDAFTLAHRSGGTIIDFYNSGELLQSSSEKVRGLLAIGDTDNDGRPELAVTQGDQIHILEQIDTTEEPATLDFEEFANQPNNTNIAELEPYFEGLDWTTPNTEPHWRIKSSGSPFEGSGDIPPDGHNVWFMGTAGDLGIPPKARAKMIWHENVTFDFVSMDLRGRSSKSAWLKEVRIRFRDPECTLSPCAPEDEVIKIVTLTDEWVTLTAEDVEGLENLGSLKAIIFEAPAGVARSGDTARFGLDNFRIIPSE